jgi:hypothetical protein
MSAEWIDGLGEKAGPLGPAARRFAREQGVDPFPRGPDGLRKLAELLDRFLDQPDASAQQESAFVEGAGAMLGLVLLDQLGGPGHRQREGTHRVALGRYGFFDPFGAIEASLEADAPRRELSGRVAMAEAEAAGNGPVARVVRSFERVLCERRPHRAIREQHELQLVLDDGSEVDLQRVADSTRDQDESACESAAARLVSMLPEAGGQAPGVPWEEARDRLLPRLVGQSFLEQLDSQGASQDTLATEALAADVHVALVLSYEGRVRYVRRDELDRWEADESEAHALAVRNLAKRSEQARFARVETEAGPLVIARTGDGLDAARLVLPGLYKVLAAELTPPLLAAVPHRDTLLACGGHEPQIVRALRERSRADAQRAPHRISEALFEVTPDGIEPARLPFDPESSGPD